MEFKITSLDDIVEHCVDNRGKTCPTTEKENEYLPLIATNCINDERLYPEFLKTRSIDEETYLNWFRSHPEPGDIIFVNKGTPGKTAFVPEKVNFCIAQDMVALRVKSEYHNRYIYAVLNDPKVRDQIDNMQVGTLIPHFKKTDFKNLKLKIITNIAKQKKIGDFYFNICKKIELNYNTIEKLQQLSQTLFKHWFIDFEFPNEEGQPYKSSGGKMVESELGEIPKRWRVGEIDNLGTIIGGGTPSKKHDEYYTDNGISWITPKDLSNDKNTFIYKGAIDITELGLKKGSARILQKDTVLFSSRAPIGYIAIAGKEVTTNQGFKSIVPDKGYSSYFIYQMLKFKLPVIEAAAGGSTFKEISGKGLKEIPVTLPTIELVNIYKEIVEPLFLQIQTLEKENQNLQQLRDTLLPKLLSGEIEIPDSLEV